MTRAVVKDSSCPRQRRHSGLPDCQPGQDKRPLTAPCCDSAVTLEAGLRGHDSAQSLESPQVCGGSLWPSSQGDSFPLGCNQISKGLRVRPASVYRPPHETGTRLHLPLCSPRSHPTSTVVPHSAPETGASISPAQTPAPSTPAHSHTTFNRWKPRSPVSPKTASLSDTQTPPAATGQAPNWGTSQAGACPSCGQPTGIRVFEWTTLALPIPTSSPSPPSLLRDSCH